MAGTQCGFSERVGAGRIVIRIRTVVLLVAGPIAVVAAVSSQTRRDRVAENEHDVTGLLAEGDVPIDRGVGGNLDAVIAPVAAEQKLGGITFTIEREVLNVALGDMKPVTGIGIARGADAEVPDTRC